MTEQATQASAWSPLKNKLFATLWLATMASNIGTWMHEVGAGWLMTTLSDSAVMVALVQAATAFPVFVAALPAGALSDIVDRRKYLIVIQLFLMLVALSVGLLTAADAMTPWLLIGLTLLMGFGSAMMMPAWAAVTPEVVERKDLQAAIALNSMGMNVARAIGPALAGLIIASVSIELVFLLNAASFFCTIAVLIAWKRPAKTSTLPAERFTSAFAAGIRFSRHSKELRSVLVRGAGFFLFASGLWALMPLLARQIPGGGPNTYGLMVGAVGAGAVMGAILLPKIRNYVRRDNLVVLAAVLYAGTMIALPFITVTEAIVVSLLLSGAAWIGVLSSLQVAAQTSLPNWVRARGLAVFMSVFMGSMAIGSYLWGSVAEAYGLELAYWIAGGLAVLSAIITRPWSIEGQDDLDLTPSMHWPEVSSDIEHDRGPVLITIEYPVEDTKSFLEYIYQLRSERLRDGAISWQVYEHSDEENLFIETFVVTSWIEHLRQHERVTHTDKEIQEKLTTTLQPNSKPKVNHYIAPDLLPKHT